MFTKSTYKLGDPCFMVVYDRHGRSEFEIVRTFAGLKQKIASHKRYRHSMSGLKIYVCPDPAWFELDELTEEAIYACDEETINAEVERIHALYGVEE